MNVDKCLTPGPSCLKNDKLARIRLTVFALVFCQKTSENATVPQKCIWRSRKCVLLVNRNVTEMYVNCGLQNARCSIFKVKIISLSFKWLIVLRSAKKKRAIKRTESLRMRLPCSKTRPKRTFTRLAHWPKVCFYMYISAHKYRVLLREQPSVVVLDLKLRLTNKN